MATHLVLVNVVVHTTSAVDSRTVSTLIKALDQRQESSGEKTCFIHVSLPNNLSSSST